MKPGVSFDDVPACDISVCSIILNVLTLYERQQIWPKQCKCINIALNLIRQSDPLLNEAWLLLSMTNLLYQLKSILKNNNYKLFDSYLLARLKQCLVKYYSFEICFGEEQRKIHTNQFVYSSFISIHEALNIVTNYKRELKNHELIDEPKTKFWNEQQMF